MSLEKKKIRAMCRKGHKIMVPCNWNINGVCGADVKPCILVSFEVKG
jgi:hypothetical protein